MEELGIEVIKRERFVSVYRDIEEDETYLSVAIHMNTQLNLFYAEIFRILHEKIQKKNIPVKIHSIDGLDFNERSYRLVYKIINGDPEEIFEEVRSLFYESILESTFSDPVKSTAVKEANVILQRRLQPQQRRAC